MSPKKILFWGVLVLVLLVAYSSLYRVREGQGAILLRLGEIVVTAEGKPKVEQPGLHFKLPIINQVRTLDVRLQSLMVQASRIMTLEQKYVLVDYFVKWRIDDLALFYQRTGGIEIRAQTLLQQQVNDSLRAAFGKRTITEVISGERSNTMQLIRKQANETAQGLGIAVVDVRIKSIDLPKEVSDSVFARMRVKREQVANQYRSDGKAQAEKIQADADAQVTVLVAQAKAQAATVRATGIAEAAVLYAEAYNKDKAFYEFYRSLEAYKNVFDSGKDLMVIQPNSQFFKFFNSAVSGTKSN